MEVKVDAYAINQKVVNLLVEKYGFSTKAGKSIAQDIALDVERILEENEDK